MSYFHILKPDNDLDLNVQQNDQKIYLKGRENIEKFLQKGYLEKDKSKRMYIYSQRVGQSLKCGLIMNVSVDDYRNGLIKRHEQTIKKKEEDRTMMTFVQ